MAALRGASQNLQKYISRPSPSISRAQLIFFRGLASQLLVKGISFSTTEETLAKAFSKCGEVIEAKIIRDKVRDRSKGYGFVTFAKEDEAQKALMDMNGKLIDGRVVSVKGDRPTRRSSDMPARGVPEPAADS